MSRQNNLTHEFVEFVPEAIADGVLYVSVQYATAVHKCCCGCGAKVVTPFTPTDWRMVFDGETISLDPSIGSWSFPCRSHYWIRRNVVRWASDWSQQQIVAGRQRDRAAKQQQFQEETICEDPTTGRDSPAAFETSPQSWWQRLARWWRSERG
jgi:hypothetical protein